MIQIKISWRGDETWPNLLARNMRRKLTRNPSSIIRGATIGYKISSYCKKKL
jgi:hypothetical protein